MGGRRGVREVGREETGLSGKGVRKVAERRWEVGEERGREERE